jgi:hypothetical protein
MGYQDAHLLSSKILPGMPAVIPNLSKEVVHYEKRDFRLPRATFKGYKCFEYGIREKTSTSKSGAALARQSITATSVAKKTTEQRQQMCYFLVTEDIIL